MFDAELHETKYGKVITGRKPDRDTYFFAIFTNNYCDYNVGYGCAETRIEAVGHLITKWEEISAEDAANYNKGE